MSLQIAAQHLASKGRGPDTTLVHMAPGEVQSLQALARAHGGTLTTNPDTGLPEAGFLSAILPMVAGAALTATGVGAPMAALLVGGGMTAATGSLRKGLMAGLGAYGGAGLMGSVTGAGTGAISQAAGANAAGAVPPITPIAEAATPISSVVNPASPDFGGALFSGPAPAVVPDVASAVPNALTPEAARIGDIYAQEQAAQNAVAQKLATTTPFETAKAGLGAIADKPSLLFNKANLGYGLAAAAPLLFQEQKGVTAPRDSEQYRYAYNPGRAMPPTRAGGVGEYTYYRPSYTRLAAEGGIMDALPVEQMSARNEAETLMANGGQMYAAGGISHLGDYSDGGRLLKGPGDGVSDDIPATIANKRPARLADGEFVVPARIVSELGNGSTDAGARKLYAMMDRVQKNRAKTVGKGKVAVNSRSDKLLPA